MLSERQWCFLATYTLTHTHAHLCDASAVKWESLRLTNRKLHPFLIYAACFLFIFIFFDWFLQPFVLYTLCNAFLLTNWISCILWKAFRTPICLSVFSMLFLFLLHCDKMQKKMFLSSAQHILIFVVKFMRFLWTGLSLKSFVCSICFLGEFFSFLKCCFFL